MVRGTMCMDDLRKMSQLGLQTDRVFPACMNRIATLLQWQAWAMELRCHPDREYVEFVVDGIHHGFWISYNHSAHSCISAPRNMVSAGQHPQPIQQYLEKEWEAGRIIGPLVADSLKVGIYISHFGVIPKPHQPDKRRLITDLSYPEGSSVNDGIDPCLCSVSYASVDDAVRAVIRLGRGTMLAKFDLESAYHMVPVHPQDCLLVGLRWQGATYVDGVLPFGLRSAPKLFTVVADALLRIMGQHGVRKGIHYIDDFLILGPADSDVCGKALETCMVICRRLGVAVTPHKTEGPGTSISFLGILIDSERMVLQLPQDKLTRLCHLIVEWRGRKCCKRQLLSLIGQLQHASEWCKQGALFLSG